MPVFNGQRFLSEAVESILSQDFEDFELLIMDDGSSDESPAIMQKYAARDARVRVVKRAHRGLVATLNEGLDLARGRWLARMDCDDISLPQRLTLQVDFLRAHPNCVFCAGDCDFVDEHGRRMGSWPDFGHSHEEIRATLRFVTAFAHDSVCFNLPLLREYGFRYDPRRLHAEDFDLWNRIAQKHPCCVLKRTVLLCRSHPHRISYRHRRQQLRQVLTVLHNYLRPQDRELPPDFLLRFMDETAGVSRHECRRLQEILINLIKAIDAEPPATRELSRDAFAFLISKMFREFSLTHGFAVTRRVFGPPPVKPLIGQFAPLLYPLSLLSCVLPPPRVYGIAQRVYGIVQRVYGIVRRCAGLIFRLRRGK